MACTLAQSLRGWQKEAPHLQDLYFSEARDASARFDCIVKIYT